MEEMFTAAVVGLFIGLIGKIVWDWLKNRRNGSIPMPGLINCPFEGNGMDELKKQLHHAKEDIRKDVSELETKLNNLDKAVMVMAVNNGAKLDAQNEYLRDILVELRRRNGR